VKVKELIKKLKAFPPDMDVTTRDDRGYSVPAGGVMYVVEWPKKRKTLHIGR